MMILCLYERMKEQELNCSNIEDAPKVEITRYELTRDTCMVEVVTIFGMLTTN